MIELIRVPGTYKLVRMAAGEPPKSGFFSYTQTDDERSLICEYDYPTVGKASAPLAMVRVAGTLDLSLIGIMRDITSVFADARVPVITLSTYDTDYILFEEKYLGVVVDAFAGAERITLRV